MLNPTFWQRRPLIGVIHLLPLPEAPRYAGNWSAIVERAVADARSYVEGGADALLLENFGDAPFYPRHVPSATIAAMTRVATEIRRTIDVPLGVNVLRNDAAAALAVAHAAAGDFIRVNILCGARVTDQGIIQGVAHDLLRLRRQLGGEPIHILADVDVKHSAPVTPRPLEEEVTEALERGGADAVIVTGPATGQAVDVEQLQRAFRAAAGHPLLVGSGVTTANAAQLAPFCNGFIVGTAAKRDGDVQAAVDPHRVAALRGSYQ